jgi:hypothetical protein
MENSFKTLWSERNDMYVHFDMSPLTDEVIWGYSDMPQLMTKDTTIELLMAYLGKNTIMPEGTILKTVKLSFEDDEQIG